MLTAEEAEALKDLVSSSFQDFLAAHPDIPVAAARSLFAKELIKSATRKAAILSAVVSFPYRLPVVGVVGPLILAVGLQVTFTIRTQFELVYSLAALYGYPGSAEELKAIAFVLVGLSDYDAVKKYAAIVGVKITIKQFVQKISGFVLVELLSYSVEGTMGPMMGRIVGQQLVANPPWYFVPLKYAGMGVSGFFGYQSTKGAGKRALCFFDESEERSAE